MGPGYVSKETSFGMRTLKEEEPVGRTSSVIGKTRKGPVWETSEVRGSLWLAPQVGVPKPFQPIRRL